MSKTPNTLRILICVGILCGTFGPSLPPLAFAQTEIPAAVLVMVTGPVHVHRAGAQIVGSFGEKLLDGDIVETGDNAEASLIFPSGQLIELGAGSRMTVRGGPNANGGSGGEGHVLARVSDQVAGDLTRYARATSGDEGLSALPAMRSASNHDRVQLLSPRNSLVNSTQPTFAWTPLDDALEYKIVLMGDGKAKGSYRAQETHWQLPADKSLDAGQTWTWSVEAMTDDGPVNSDHVPFEVASEDAAAALQKHISELLPLLDSEEPARVDSAHYLLGSVHKNLGFYDEAIRHYEILVERHARPELQRELGELYRRVGRFENSAEMFRNALR